MDEWIIMLSERWDDRRGGGGEAGEGFISFLILKKI